MPISRQFSALARIAGLVSATWAAIGAVIGVTAGSSLTSEPPLLAALNFMVMYGVAGGIAGIATSLLVSHAESGRDLREVSSLRLVIWGMAGGMAPAFLLAGLGLLAGESLRVVMPLASSAVGGGIVGGAVWGTASLADVSAGDARAAFIRRL